MIQRRCVKMVHVSVPQDVAVRTVEIRILVVDFVMDHVVMWTKIVKIKNV